jgi:probable phosphoglycerate mutase
MLTSITFVRHGNTDFNVEKRAQGHLNNPLNETGFKQAKAVAERLAEEKWDLLFSSDLLRARQTAEIISKAIGLPITAYDVRLREISRGQIEGTIEEERIARWGVNWRELDLGEESLESVRKRGVDFVMEAVAKYPGKKMLLVSHGLLIRETLKGLMQDESTGTPLANTSVTTVVYKDGQWRYELYGCTRHLDTERREAQEYRHLS